MRFPFKILARFSEFSSQFRNSNFHPLKIVQRNSEVVQLSVANLISKPFSIQIQNQQKLKDLKLVLEQQLQLKNVKFLSEERIPISEETQISTFLNNLLYITSDTTNFYTTLPPISNQKNPMDINIRDLDYPHVITTQIQAYLNRINLLSQVRYNSTNLLNVNQLKKADMTGLVIQAIPQNKNWIGEPIVVKLYKNWEDLYWRIEHQRKQEQRIIQKSQKQARVKMSLGLAVILANINFIGFGTYVFYSWDIIQPMAYFLASLGNLFCFNQFFKLKKQFTYEGYLQYLTQKYMQKHFKQAKFDRVKYQQQKKTLSIIQSKLKDYFYIRL